MEKHFQDNWILRRGGKTYILCYATALEQVQFMLSGESFKVMFFPTLDTVDEPMHIAMVLEKDEEGEEVFTLNVFPHENCAPIGEALEIIAFEEGRIVVTEVDW